MPSVRDSFLQSGKSTQRVATQSGLQPDFLIQIEPNEFLVKNGTSANIAIVYTPLNGFVGDVTLSAMVSPVESFGPTISFNPATVKLNSSLPGSPSSSMVVNTTIMTESGLYVILVNGSSALISHSTTATVGVTSTSVPANGADLVYKAHFGAVAYVGGSITLKSTFADLGYVPIEITKLQVSFNFGTFQADKSCSTDTLGLTTCISPYLSLRTYEEKTTALTIQIPDDTRPGNYNVTITVSWGLLAGCFPLCPAPDLLANTNLTVYSYPSNPPPSPPQPPSNLGSPGLYNGIFGFMALGGAIAIVVVYLAVRMDQRNQPRFDRVTMEPTFCANCKTPAVFGTRFCGQCGHKILETRHPSKDAFGV